MDRPSHGGCPATSQSRASGRTRKPVQKFSFIQEPELQLRLLDQLNELCITDIDEFERAVGDITFANDVARDYFDTTLLCGWMGDYGKYAVHITDQEELRLPDDDLTRGTEHDGTPDDITTDGAHRYAKGGRLPRPVFDMASGTSFIIRNHTKETSPLFQARRVSEYADPDTIDGSAAKLPDSIREAARAAQPRVVFKRSGVSISD